LTYIDQQGMEKILQEGAEALGPEVVTLTGPNRYRPPAGFMNENIQEFPEVCDRQSKSASLCWPAVERGGAFASIGQTIGILHMVEGNIPKQGPTICPCQACECF
jgi:hypothetical protein